MSFKSKFISAVTSAFAVAAFSTFAAAQDTNTTGENNSMQKQEMRERGRGSKRGIGGKGMRGKHDGEKMMARGLGKLNLSDAQKQQISVISQNFRTSTQTQREELRTLGMKRRDGIITADEQAKAKELRTQLKASGEQMRNSIQAILTAEQRAQLDQIKQEMKARKAERRQNRQLPQSQDN